MFKYIYFFFILLCVNTSYSSEYFKDIVLDDHCPKLNYSYSSDSYINDNIENIEIKFENGKAWIKNLLKANLNNLITDNYKKKYKSKVIVNYKDKTSCIFNAKIRLHGDTIHHINTKNFLSSLDVELINGNIIGVVKFKLFVPNNHSRHMEYEVFNNTLLSEMGFLAPRTSLIDVKILSQKSKYIFQEKIVKEFIEYNNLRESFLIEGNENFIIWEDTKTTWTLQNQFVNTRINNIEKFKNKDSEVLIYQALDNINHEYLNYNKRNHFFLEGIFSIPINSIHAYLNSYFYLDLSTLENPLNNSDINLYSFESIVSAIDGMHGLIPKNRKFYYDYLNRSFKPIFYDAGGAGNFGLDKIEINDLAITKNGIIGSKQALKLLNKVNINDLYFKLSKRGLIKSKEIINLKLENINENLKKISEISLDSLSKKYTMFSKEDLIESRDRLKKNIYEINYYKEIFENNLLLRDDNLNYYFVCNFDTNKNCEISEKFIDFEKINFDLIFKTNDSFIKCNIELECEDIFLNYNDFAGIVSGKHNIKKNKVNIFAGNFENFKKEKNVNKNIKMISIDDTRNFSITDEEVLNIDDFFYIYAKGRQKIYINKNTKTIKFSDVGQNSYTIFFNGVINNWNIEFNGQRKIADNLNMITGCINFYNIIHNSTKVTSKNANCEDALNFVNSKGNIDSIIIDNAFSDAVDFDFSNLKIDKIIINKAGNDCLDLSSGKYHVNEVELSNCGDKGISVGEKTYFTNNLAFIENSNVAVASKDSSEVYLNIVKPVNCKIACFAAYRKKQEYNGAFLEVKQSIYENNVKIFKDKFSEIILK